MATQLKYHGFDICCNPVGTLFNPDALATLLERCADKRAFTTEDFLKNNGLNFCWETAHSLAGSELTEVIAKHEQARSQLTSYLMQSSHLVITLGTSIVHELRDGRIVANNHKQAGSLFTKRQMSPVEVEAGLNRIHTAAQRLNPKIKIVVSVSPVRHTREGMPQNAASKATLLLAAQTFAIQDHVTYLPVYEMVMDELRDYRFFASDLIHLNATGVELVWSRFRESVHPDHQSRLDEVAAYRKLAAHKSRTDSIKHKSLVEAKRTALTQQYNYLQL